MNRRVPGFTLVEILIALALLGGLATAFMMFQRNAQKVTSNLAKLGETAAIDGNIRALLFNKASCIATVRNIPGIPTNGAFVPEQDIPGIYSFMQGGGTPKVYEVGAVHGGVRITAMKATVGEESRKLRLVHVVVRTRKEGDTLGRNEYSYDYYINVKMVAGAPDSCVTLDDGSGKLVLSKYEKVELLSSSLPPVSPYPYKRFSISVGQPTNFGYPQWEPGPQLSPTANCDYEEPVQCPFVEAPVKAIVAEGDLLVYSFQGKVSMGIRNYPTGTRWSFGAMMAVVVKDDANNVISDVPIKVSGTFEVGEFRHHSMTTPTVAVDVQRGRTYRFLLRLGTDSSIPPAGGFEFFNWFPAQGGVYHYTRTSEGP